MTSLEDQVAIDLEELIKWAKEMAEEHDVPPEGDRDECHQ